MDCVVDIVLIVFFGSPLGLTKTMACLVFWIVCMEQMSSSVKARTMNAISFSWAWIQQSSCFLTLKKEMLTNIFNTDLHLVYQLFISDYSALFNIYTHARRHLRGKIEEGNKVK